MPDTNNNAALEPGEYADLVALVRERIGTEFDEEAHFSGDEARQIASAIETLVRERDEARASNEALMRERTKLIETKREQLARLTARAEAAEARLSAVEGALKPFAQAANIIERDYGRDTPDAQMQFPPLAMSELRRAREALATITGGENER